MTLSFCRTVALLCLLWANAAQAQQTQVWPEIDLSFPLGSLQCLALGQLRLDTQQANPQFEAAGLIVTQPIQRAFSLSAGYLFADLPQMDSHAHVPLLALTSTLTRGHFQLSDTNRFERLFAFSNQPVRYRNKVSAAWDLGAGSRYRLALAEEYFQNLSTGSWNQNRISAAITQKLSPRTQIQAYLLERSAPRSKTLLAAGAVLTIHLHARTRSRVTLQSTGLRPPTL